MRPVSNEIINRESASVQFAPGEYFEFPLVDNKDLFPNFFKTNSNFNFHVQCYLVDTCIYALYLCKGNIAYLVCAWECKDEINEQAMKTISANQKLHYLLN